LRGVLEYVMQFNPRRVVVTGGAGAEETENVMRYSGMMGVIEDLGVEFFDHNRKPVIEVELPYAPNLDVIGPQRFVMVNPRVLEYETLISVSQIKMHATATVTMSLKNIAMSYPAADFYGHPRGKQYHKHDFFTDMHSFIASMAKRFPIRLAINVGHPAMVGTGPIGGHVAWTGIVVASLDPLAADVVGAKLLGFNLQGVRHLWEAARLGVGRGDIKQYEFAAMKLPEAIERFTSSVYGHKLEI